MSYHTNPDNIISYGTRRNVEGDIVEVNWEVEPRPIIDFFMALIGKEKRSKYTYHLDQGNWVDEYTSELAGLNECLFINGVLSYLGNVRWVSEQ